MTDLVHVTRGVWRPPAVVADLAGRVAAVLSAYPGDTVVCGRTAALLHGLWLPPEVVPNGHPIELIIHPSVRVPAQRAASYRPGIRARRMALLDDEVTILNGLPVTSEGRTWLDLAQMLAMPDLVAAGDSAVRGAATFDEIAELIDRGRHRRGVVRARAALPLLDPRARSRPESHLRYALVGHGLPKPEVNKPIYTDNGEWLAEPDLSYEDVRLALEYNGADHAKVTRMQRDLTRGVDVSTSGWRTETFGPVQVFSRSGQIATLIHRLRAERRGLSHARSPIWG